MSDETRETGADPQTGAKHHPRRLHPSDMYGICRKSRGETGQQAWIVRLSRGGRSFQSTFADSSFGGRAQALHVARAYRDAVLEVVPPLTRAEMRQVQRRKAPGEHTSEITGVTYAKETHGRAAAWIARIELPADNIPGRPTKGAKRPRRSIVRSFSVAKHGYTAAKAAAEEARLDMLNALQDGNDPALRSHAVEILHRRLGRKVEKAGRDDDDDARRACPRYPADRLCCTNPMADSACESSVIAGWHEQTDTSELQDPELAQL